MLLGSIVSRLTLVFFASELVLSLVKRSARADGATSADRGTRLMLVVVITASITAAVVLSGFGPARWRGSPAALATTALALLVSGLAVRWWAVMTLGKFFTVDVAIHRDHALVDRGPYRFVRHPSYTGLLLAFAGMGVAFGNALSLFVLVVPIAMGLLRRIRVEEQALHEGLGATYDAYCARTRRLIPGLY